jgi:hypothetical protein
MYCETVEIRHPFTETGGSGNSVSLFFFQEMSGVRINFYVIDVIVLRFLCRRQVESTSDEATVREEHDPGRLFSLL